MATDLTLRAAGLYTDPNPHSDAPPGALRIADNVVIRRAGVLEPRPGFRDEGVNYESGVSAAQNVFRGLHVAPTGDSTEWYAQTNTLMLEDDGTTVALLDEYSGNIIQPGDYLGASAANLYRRLYVPATTAGVIAALSAGEGRAAGLPRPQTPELTLSDESEWLPTGSFVAYRAAFADYVGERLIVSAPSGYVYVQNASGASRGVEVRVSFAEAPNVQAGWKLQIYRSPSAAGAIPSDEMFLVIDYEITAADVTAGFVSLLDEGTLETAGASLYTNATQQGIVQENGRPPAAKVVAAFNEMMFFGNVQEAQSLQLTFSLDLSSGPSLFTGGTADFTSGDPNITRTSGGAASRDTQLDLYVVNAGEYVADATGTTIPEYSYVTVLGSPVFTMSNNAKATASAQWETVVWAHIYEDPTGAPSTYDPYYWYEADSTQTVNLASGQLRGNGRAMELWAQSVARRQGITATVLDGNSDVEYSIRFERQSYVAGLGPDDQFSIRLPQSMAPFIRATTTVFNNTAADGDIPPGVEYYSTAATFPNRVFYSKKQQPEHVPPVNYIDIGSDSEPIIAMKATRRALFIFKTDGIWTISGDTPETLRVEQIDSTARLLHPKAVAVGGDRVFAWTDAGVVMLSEGGIAQNLSASAIEPDLRAIQVSLQGVADPADGTTSGVFMFYQDGKERLLLGVPDALGDGFAGSVYQYDMRTQAWTRWTLDSLYPASGAAVAGRILFGGNDLDQQGDVARETLASDEAPFSDVTVTDSMVSASTSGGVSTVLLTGSRNNFPVGTWAYQVSSSARGVVIATRDGGDGPDEIDVYMMSGSITTVGDYSDLLGYQPVTQCIEWIAKTANAPTVTKHWQRGALTYESDRRMYEATLSFRSDMVHTATEITTQHVLQDEALSEDTPFIVTRDHTRSAVLYPKLCIEQGGAQWALSVLHLDYELGSVRSGRRAR